MPDAKEKRPIIVIKKKGGHGGHHGGAWKVAYADFVTAMMSLFIVLWLMSTSDQVKKAIAGYFNDPKGSGAQMGSAAVNSSASETVAIDRANVEKLKDEIQKAILKQTDLNKLSKQIEMTVTGEGLRIDLIEGSGGTFFQSGSPKLSDNGVQLLALLAGQLKVLPNQVLIEGHTDAQPFSSTNGYTNWELSADRANAARRLLETGGIRAGQVSQVRGYADQNLRLPANPLDPSNRRVSLIVQWVDASSPAAQTAAQPAANSAAAETSPTSAHAKVGNAKSPAATPSADTRSAETGSADAKPGTANSNASPAGAKVSNAPAPASTTPANPSAPAAKPAPAAAKPTSVLARLRSLIPGKKN
jgi:chemotaxis protein MotB